LTICEYRRDPAEAVYQIAADGQAIENETVPGEADT
jgi:hypothetical protein